MQLVLASTSRYRRELLGRLGIPFSVVDPGVAEERVPGEAPEVMARRLLGDKTLAVANRLHDAPLIRRGQVAVGNSEVLRQTRTRQDAARELPGPARPHAGVF